MNSDELGGLMKERSGLEDIKKVRRLDAMEKERYVKLSHDIEEYLANEDNLIFD